MIYIIYNDEATEADLAKLTGDAARDPDGIAKEVLAQRRFITWINSAYSSMLEGRVADAGVARLGKVILPLSPQLSSGENHRFSCNNSSIVLAVRISVSGNAYQVIRDDVGLSDTDWPGRPCHNGRQRG